VGLFPFIIARGPARKKWEQSQKVRILTGFFKTGWIGKAKLVLIGAIFWMRKELSEALIEIRRCEDFHSLGMFPFPSWKDVATIIGNNPNGESLHHYTTYEWIST